MANYIKSEYLLGLESGNKDIASRYKEKIRVIQNVDPFTLSDWTEDILIFPAVSAFDIVSYLVLTHSFYTNDQMKAYKSLAAYKYFEAGFIQNCKAQKIGEHVVGLAQVKHSQKMNQPPLKVWIICQPQGSIISAHCTCMAGHSEVCSHVGALLYGLEYTHQAARNLSPTDIKAKWIVPSGSNVPIVKLSEMEFKKSGNDMPSSESTCSIPAIEGEELVKFLQEMKDNGDDAALMRIVEPFASEIYSNMQISLPKLYNIYKKEHESLSFKDLCDLTLSLNEKIDSDLSKKILVATTKQSMTTEWFEQRAGRITASNFKKACRTSISKPSLSLNICYPLKVTFKSKPTEWGLVHEKTALEELKVYNLEKHGNFQMEQTGLHIDCDFPFLGASPDAMVSCDCCGRGCVEVKCPYVLKSVDFKDYIKMNISCLMYNENNQVVLKPDHAYYYQIQMQMKITKSKYCYFVIWSPKSFFIIRVTFIESFWDVNFPKIYEFHKKVVLPELLGRYYTRGRHLDQRWCYCDDVDNGRPMIRCDSEDCDIQWFHIACVGCSNVMSNVWTCRNCSS